MKTPTQPAGELAGLIRKYYPNLGEHLPSPTWPALAAEWFSGLTRRGAERIDYYVADRHEKASNKEEFLYCLAALLAEAEQHAHLPGYGLPDNLTPQRESELEASGRAALRAVREWHTLASLTPIEQFLHRARKIELWQNERHQLTTRNAGYEEWNEEYGALLRAMQRAIPTAKKRELRAAYTGLNLLLPTIAAGRPLKWNRLYEEGHHFFSSNLTATYAYSDFAPLRPTRNTTNQISEFFFLRLHVHLCEKEWHVWQALILLAGALRETAPPTPETFRERQTEPGPAARALDTPKDETGPARPWAKIDALAESIDLRKNGVFLPAPKWVAVAVAGMIDALCEEEILPASGELKRLYAEFSLYYGRKIGADRVGKTRLAWQKKARIQLEKEH